VARRFVRKKHGVAAALEDAEIDLLARLFSDVEELLRPDLPAPAHPWAAELGLDDTALQGVGGDDPPAAFDDPALARLLPPARRDDDKAAAEFRRFTELGLRDRKRAALRSALSVLEGWRERSDGDQVMSEAQARDWTTSLTDVRLVLAERLGIETDDDAEALHERDPDDLDPDDPLDWLAMVYDFVTWVQESLTEVLLEALPAEGDGRRLPPDL
jgi:hypothetical protein